MKINFNIDLTKKQKEAYDLAHRKDVRYLICKWSRQSGKSVFSEIMLIEYFCKPNTFNAYISPSFSQGRKVYKEIVTLIERTGLIKKANASTLTIESIYGSTIQFFSMESPTAIRGYTVSGILVMDEAAFFPDLLPSGEEPWASVIMPITKARQPKVLVISTPRGKRGMFFDMYNKALTETKGYAQLTATIYDDNLITEEEINEIKTNISDVAFKEEFLVEFLDSSLTYFTGFEHCFKDISHKYQKTYIGVDLSANGKDETIVTKINENNEVEQFTITGTLDSKYQKIADIFNSSTNLQYSYIEGNSIGAPMINEIKKLVKEKHKIQEWTTTNHSKNDILSKLAVSIAKQEITFDKKDKNLYSQFGTFIYKFTKNGNMQLQAMDGKKDDKIMSLAIALEARNLQKSYNTSNFAIIDIGLSRFEIN